MNVLGRHAVLHVPLTPSTFVKCLARSVSFGSLCGSFDDVTQFGTDSEAAVKKQIVGFIEEYVLQQRSFRFLL